MSAALSPFMMNVKRAGVGLAMMTLSALPFVGCSVEAVDTGQSSDELGNGYDHKFWLDSRFPKSTPHFMYGATWYDSDIPWTTGSIVRLPADAKYIGNLYATVHCTDGTTESMRSPEFEATVGGKTRKFIFNHLEKIYIGSPVGTWFNGGAVVGLTGGGTCITGHPTYSSGPHFCNEVEGEDPYTFWHPLGSSYVSTCKHSNGTSGASNPACLPPPPPPTNSCSGTTCGSNCCPSGDFCGTNDRCCDGSCVAGCPC